MGNFSRNPDDELNNAVDKKYVGVRIEQNVPLLERDLNLATDLLGANLRGLDLRPLPADFGMRKAVAYSPFRTAKNVGDRDNEVITAAMVKQDLDLLLAGRFTTYTPPSAIASSRVSVGAIGSPARLHASAKWNLSSNAKNAFGANACSYA